MLNRFVSPALLTGSLLLTGVTVASDAPESMPREQARDYLRNQHEAHQKYWEQQGVVGISATRLAFVRPGETLTCPIVVDNKAEIATITSEDGPFYCDATDEIVMPDAGIDDVLGSADIADVPYRVALSVTEAHELAHAVDKKKMQATPASGVKTELRADCRAGASVATISPTMLEPAVGFINEIGRKVIDDPRIGHGTAEQRIAHFVVGATHGVLSCDALRY